MKYIFYIIGSFITMICIIGCLKSEGSEFFFITLSLSFLFFYAGHKIGKYNEEQSSNIKDGNQKRSNFSNKETEVYTKNIEIPSVSKNTIKLPKKDNWETGYLFDEESSIPLNLLTLIEYIDANNQYSKRRITIKKMVHWYDEYALLAYCHEREAHRTFKLSGIKSMCDLETGELISDPYNYLVQRFQDSPIGRWTKFLKEFENEILTLVFVAKADGRMTQKERKAIYDYANIRSKETLEYETADKEIKNLYCDLKDFNNCLSKIKGLEEIEKANFISALEEIIKTDKNADPMELAALEKIKNKIL
ncbi:TerB family tellurite resistance protein [Leptospira sp. 2 VSF19]|uniref:TerB family tellurite resistance protein n=1 Tax=Leptospira soteropolitanensis TaxID=2950025 RepID=A0AAW5VUH5_9LEPT|nr:WYL domain-containing protein [Leptospira soteropolitanensis]MCW7494794.1 TerB family tellurite resistance protein [Leptospira soteropolitanensis]MCW7502388.1 TerB family tellurite resistance protein [Leptospira soteropolitanensis]MCW7524622.1 TerB family tellurite resistance protein [Leptospira soteropolitanensis]MCW7528489.1 TerB family tellurite resistance protein [Leptospira soteropolitanensis]MCW7532354.1 TerB family tellurite resistance protein [Leptospira soteropolitanensis]